MEDDFTRILQFHDSFPRCVESYRYEDNASFMSSSATYLWAPDWLILMPLPKGFSSGLKFIYRPETLYCFPQSSLDYCGSVALLWNSCPSEFHILLLFLHKSDVFDSRLVTFFWRIKGTVRIKAVGIMEHMHNVILIFKKTDKALLYDTKCCLA